MVGKTDTDTTALTGLPNVHLVGWRDYKSLPAWCKGFDVAMLPFRVNRLTLAANPLKLREYLAAGLPVVATAIPEARRLDPWVHVGRSDDELLHYIDGVIDGGLGGPNAIRSRAMEAESWDAKVEAMSAVVEDFLQRPSSRRARA